MRRWWHGPQVGSIALADEILDRSGTTITPGVIEMACRVNLSATSFVRAAAALERTAQVKLSGERLRQVVEAAGRGVLNAQQDDAIAVTWHAEDCVVPDSEKGEKTRVYTGCDGVMVPIITDAEKIKRRDNVKAKRRHRGKKCKPLPPRRRGSDLSWKEFKVAFFYSEDAKRQHVAFTHGNHIAAGRLLRREADRLRFQKADERVGLVDGATWIREQMQLHFAELDALGLDFYHLSENVHRGRRKVFGEDSPEGKAWADELMHVFKHGGCSAAWERLLPWRTGLRGKVKREAADRLLHFISAQEHDPLPGVPGAWLADWQWADRIAMQAMHEAAERLRPPLGSAQRHGGCGPRYAGQKRPMASSLAKRPLRHDLRPPRTLVTHIASIDATSTLCQCYNDLNP